MIMCIRNEQKKWRFPPFPATEASDQRGDLVVAQGEAHSPPSL